MQIKYLLAILSLPQRNTKFSTPMRLLDRIRECFGEGGMSAVVLKECEASWKGINEACWGERSLLEGDGGSAAEQAWLFSRGAVLPISAHLQIWASSLQRGVPLVPLQNSSCVDSELLVVRLLLRFCAGTAGWLSRRADPVGTDGPLKPALSQILESTYEFSSCFLALKIYTSTTSWLSLAIRLMKNQDAKRY